MILTAAEIYLILNKLKWEEVIEESSDFPYRVVREVSGYSSNIDIRKLQSKLSIMLQMAHENERT